MRRTGVEENQPFRVDGGRDRGAGEERSQGRRSTRNERGHNSHQGKPRPSVCASSGIPRRSQRGHEQGLLRLGPSLKGIERAAPHFQIPKGVARDTKRGVLNISWERVEPDPPTEFDE